MQGSFIDRIKEYICSNQLLDDSAKVVVGLSGGADSTALLLVLLRLGYKVHAVHCNFHLRGKESDRDQQFATDLCARLGVSLEICQYQTQQYAQEHGISIEMAARQLRYADFDRIMKECGASAVCIAHHRDDSVETVLLNLIRGTGIKGLTGIKPRNGHIIRPLLCVSRLDIENWLKECGQPYVTDSTNLETDYTRNKIRLGLLPLMRDINPSVDESIMATAHHLQQAYDIYAPAINDIRSQVITQHDGVLGIGIDKLRTVPSVQGFLFEILSPLGFNDAQISGIAHSLDSQPGTQFLSATHQVIKDRDRFTVSALEAQNKDCITLDTYDGATAVLPSAGTITVSTAPAGTPISAAPNIATFDAALIKGPLSIRRWQEGDWFIPFGMKGRKLVSDYLTDRKVSALERQKQMVVTCKSDIIWILGQRSDNRYRVTDTTVTQLILTLS
jgi:tRNA(Ile)-lysidine synthase